MEKQKPTAKFQAGQVACALWGNEITVGDRTVTVLRATLERRYKDDNGGWRSSKSFSRNEVPLAIHCLQQAFTTMIEHQRKTNDDEEVV